MGYRCQLSLDTSSQALSIPWREGGVGVFPECRIGGEEEIETEQREVCPEFPGWVFAAQLLLVTFVGDVFSGIVVQVA